MKYKTVERPGHKDFLRFKRMEQWHVLNFLHVLILVSALIGSYAWGRHNGYQGGATQAQLTTLAEVRRQCEGPWPLLLDNEFFRCYSMGEFLGDEGAK